MASVHGGGNANHPPNKGILKNNKKGPATSSTASTVITPHKSNNNSVGLERHMAVDKNIVDELLLVCGVIGTTAEVSSNTGVETLVPVTDCLNWLQDLQRALRRDEDLYRPISLLLGKWNVVQKKLLPLVLTCRYDTPMVLTIVKILVILTKPLHENTMRAGRLVIDTKSKKVEEEVIEEQKRLRENALMQSKMLMEYKKAIVHHPSHRRRKNNKNKDNNKNKENSIPAEQDNDDDEGGVLSIFVSLLAEPLSKTGTKRTDADHLTIELVLHLFRNILSAEPIIKGSQEATTECAQLHNECISLFERELVLEILLVICQEMELRENAQYNLLMMELLHHLLKGQDPTAVARCMEEANAKKANTSSSSSKENQQQQRNSGVDKGGAKKQPTTTTTTTTTTKTKPNKPNYQKGVSKTVSRSRSSSSSSAAAGNSTNGLLRAHLARDRQQFRSNAPSRHGNFGGTIMKKRQDGKNQYVSASAVLDPRSQGGSARQAAADLAGPAKRKNKKTEPFIGSGRTLLAHTAVGKLQNSSHRGPAALRAQKTLHRFCQRFLDKCYGPIMKSLKNEFRRDSVRLDGAQDQVIFFRIIWFLFQWFRVSGYGRTLQLQAASQEAAEKTDNNDAKNADTIGERNANSALGQLIFTMDVFSFNLVLNAASTFSDQKRYTHLAQTVALYSEMMHMLYSMYESKDPTEQLMALGLMDRLFYNAENVDRLPQLLTKWTPSTTTREYACDLVELCHLTLKLLDANNKACANIRESEEARQATVQVKGGRGKNKTKIQTNDAVLQMKLAASDYDVTSYFIRKIVSNHVVFLYTKLLEQYEFNAPHVNHRIVAFFLRLAKVKIVEGEDDKPQSSLLLGNDGRDPLTNLLAPKTTTLEPMLYNMPMLLVLNKILNNSIIAKDPSYSTLRSWAAGIVHNFANRAAANPVLFVEILFKHPFPQRFCENSTNMYVSEELRMIAEKELLMEAHRLEMLNQSDNDDDDDDRPEDEEQEFLDADIEGVRPDKESKKKRQKSDADDSSDDDSDSSSDKGKKLSKANKKKRRKSDDSDGDSNSEEEEDNNKVEGNGKLASKSNKKKKRRLQSKSKKIAARSESESSDDEELEFETAPSAASSSATTEGEATALAKKLKRKVFADSSDEEEEALISPASKLKRSTGKVVGRPNLDDSSDEEMVTTTIPKRKKPQKKKPRKRTSASLDDSSDSSSDEDDGEETPRKAKLAEETNKMSKAIEDAEDSNSDSDDED